MTNEKIVERRLIEVCDKHFKTQVGRRFKDKPQFLDALYQCYALIANRCCAYWNDCNGKDWRRKLGDSRSIYYIAAEQLPFEPIHSRELDSLCMSYRLKGRKRKVPYSRVLAILELEDVIEIDRSYLKGHYSMSYRLKPKFMVDVLCQRLEGVSRHDELCIYKCFDAVYPKRLLEKRLNEARKIYADLQTFDGVRLVLPDGWDKKGLSVFGEFAFDGKLDIENLIRGMKLFREHKVSGYSYGRFYDWFTLCPSAVRRYLTDGNRSYREIVDCPSGFFWMFALYGFRMGRVGVDECQRMIDQCFSGSFYTAISGLPKTGAVKVEFMKVLNMRASQIEYMREIQNELFFVIKDRLAFCYPELSAFLELIRANPKWRQNKSIGRFLHAEITKIEREIMEGMERELERRGMTKLRRVHDAIWGLDSLEKGDAQEILKKVVIKYFNSLGNMDKKLKYAA